MRCSGGDSCIDSNWALSDGQWKASNMYIDEVNTIHCGIPITGGNGTKAFLEMLMVGNEKSGLKSQYITNQTVAINAASPDPPFGYAFMAPYSSGVGKFIVPTLQENDKLGIFPGSSSPSIFSATMYSIGMLIPATSFLFPVFKTLGTGNESQVNGQVKTVNYVHQDRELTNTICETINGLAPNNGMTVVGSHKVPLDKFTDETYMNGIFEELKNENADLTIWCTYETGCQAMSDGYKRMGNYGNAIAFIICTGLDSFEQYAGADLIDFLGVSLWNEQIPGADAYTGQTPLEFSNQFKAQEGGTPTYQMVAAAGAMSLYAQAMNATGCVNSTCLKNYILDTNNYPFKTVYGDVSLNEYGQNTGTAYLVQYQISGNTGQQRRSLQTTTPTLPLAGNVPGRVVYPSTVNPDANLIYPAATALQRSCQTNGFVVTVGGCQTSGGTCAPSGLCSCPPPRVSRGIGANARCITQPEVAYDYIGITLRSIGYALMAIIMFCCVLLVIWMLVYRKDRIIRASQPLFMMIVVFGVFIYAAAIFPLTADDEWTDVTDGNTAWCMTTIWLGAMGFVLIFSALFAKAWRINKIFQNKSLRRVVITPRDVIWPMLVLGAVMVSVLSIFTWVPDCPYIWETTTTADANDSILTSSGRCQTQPYSGIMDGMVAAVQIIALGLCCWQFYLCRNVSVDYSESKWISYAVLSTLQVIVIALPFQFMDLNPDSYFLVMLLKFVIICVAVLVFVFVPKIYYWKREKWPPAAKSQTESEKLAAAANRRVDTGTARTSNALRSSAESTFQGYGAKARMHTHGSMPGKKIKMGMASTASGEKKSSLRFESDANGAVNGDGDEEPLEIIDTRSSLRWEKGHASTPL